MQEAKAAQDRGFAWEFLPNCLGRARGSARGSCAMSLDSLVPGFRPAHQRSTLEHLAVSQQVAGSTHVEHSRCVSNDSTAIAPAQSLCVAADKKSGSAFHFGTAMEHRVLQPPHWFAQEFLLLCRRPSSSAEEQGFFRPTAPISAGSDRLVT